MQIVTLKSNLQLEKYDDSHGKYLSSLVMDDVLYPYLLVAGDRYMIRYNKQLAGCLLLNPELHGRDTINMTILLDNDHRSQVRRDVYRSGIGTYVLNSASNDLFKYFPKIILDIKKSNKASVNMAIKAGYDIDFHLLEKYHDEDYFYTPYVRERKW